MATKTFLKSIVIEDRNAADKFVSALENAENYHISKTKIIVYYNLKGN